MYIQPEREREEPLSIPRNYSGNAFRQVPKEPTPPDPPPILPVAPPEEPISLSAEPPEQTPIAQQTEESVSTSALIAEKGPLHGLRGRFPFLSSLLPPSRGEHKKGGILPEWALIGAVILLFLWEDEENDILPFLLLLLLWD